MNQQGGIATYLNFTCHSVPYGERQTRHTGCPHGDGLSDEGSAELQPRAV